MKSSKLDSVNQLLATADPAIWRQALQLLRPLDGTDLLASVLSGCEYVSEPHWEYKQQTLDWEIEWRDTYTIKKLYYYPTPAHVYLVANGLAHPRWTTLRARRWRSDAKSAMRQILGDDGKMQLPCVSDYWCPQPYLEPIENGAVYAWHGPIPHHDGWEELGGSSFRHKREDISRPDESCDSCCRLAQRLTVAEYAMSKFVTRDIRMWGGAFWFRDCPNTSPGADGSSWRLGHWVPLRRYRLVGLSQEQLFASASAHHYTDMAEKVFGVGGERSYTGFPATQLSVLPRAKTKAGPPPRSHWTSEMRVHYGHLYRSRHPASP